MLTTVVAWLLASSNWLQAVKPMIEPATAPASNVIIIAFAELRFESAC
jgi:hypothetical protein